MEEDSWKRQMEDLKVEEDNWKHRSTGMVCRTCMYFVEKKPGDYKSIEGGFGRCRRRSPTMNGFPAVFGTDWCGDHKLDENTIAA